MSHEKTALALIWLVGLATCYPPVIYFDQDSSDYGEYPIEEEEAQSQQTLQRAPGYHMEAVGQPGAGPVEFHDLDDRQTSLASITNSMISMAMGFISPMLTNLGIGASNAILATLLRRRLALIPEARKSMSAVLKRPKVPSATIRAL